MGDKRNNAARKALPAVRRLVIKLGTNAICGQTGRLELKTIRSLARQISALIV